MDNENDNLKKRSNIYKNDAQIQPISSNSPQPLQNQQPQHLESYPGNMSPQPKKRHRLRNLLLFILGVILTGGLIFGAYVFFNIKSSVDKTYDGLNMTSARNVSSVLSAKKPVSILLLGTDTGAMGRDFKGRTDSIMIVTINPAKKTTTIVSIPRDSMVSIVGYEANFPSKLNDAYAYGSAETTIKTIQNYLNIPIDFYALVNMGALEKIVDKVGGIKVISPLTFTYRPDDDKPDVYKFTEGSSNYEYAADGVNFKQETIMNGKAALAFSRMRYTDPEGDYGRTKRQRLVIEALLGKTAKISSVLNQNFLDTISSNVKTNLTFDDMLSMASSYRGAVKNIKTDHLQGGGYGYVVGGVNESFELVRESEKQRVTNLIRKSLGLKAKDTGYRFGGQVTNGVQIESDAVWDQEIASGTNP